MQLGITEGWSRRCGTDTVGGLAVSQQYEFRCGFGWLPAIVAPWTTPRQPPDRNLAMELVRVTEAAALASGRWMGRGDKEGADQAAVDAMRIVLQRVPMDGVVVIGEGEKDKAPMLFNGEHIGDGTPPMTDVAVDPIDGTSLTAQGRGRRARGHRRIRTREHVRPGAVRVHGEDRRRPGSRRCHRYHRDARRRTLPLSPRAKDVSVNDLTVVVLDRPRHAELIEKVRATGARIILISDGDVAGAIATSWPESGVDVLIGIGGTPEGVISAAALKCMGGAITRAGSGRATTPNEGRHKSGVRLRPRDQRRGPRPGQQLLLRGTGITGGTC